jgi:L-ascorbate metabolism protein UlaG (beta-lactamase superfamily)
MIAAPSNVLELLARRALPPESVALVWLGQASFALRLAGATLLIDPFLSPHPERLVPAPISATDARDVDLVLITHDHLDHLDDESVRGIAAASPDAAFVVPDDLVDRMTQLGTPRARIHGLSPDGHAELRAVTVDAVPAAHGVTMDDAYRVGPFLGYVLSAGGARIYHSGDTVPFGGLVERLRVLDVHLALLPINGRDAEREAQGIVGNLDAREAAELAAEIGADAAAPMHWDMFAWNPGDPSEFVAASQTTVIVPRHGRPFVYTAPGSAR